VYDALRRLKTREVIDEGIASETVLCETQFVLQACYDPAWATKVDLMISLRSE